MILLLVWVSVQTHHNIININIFHSIRLMMPWCVSLCYTGILLNRQMFLSILPSLAWSLICQQLCSIFLKHTLRNTFPSPEISDDVTYWMTECSNSPPLILSSLIESLNHASTCFHLFWKSAAKFTVSDNYGLIKFYRLQFVTTDDSDSLHSVSSWNCSNLCYGCEWTEWSR